MRPDSMRPDPAAPGPRKLRVVFPLISVLPKPPQLPYGAKYICLAVFSVFPVFPLFWVPVSEPGFLDFQICHYRDFSFCNIFLKNMLMRYRGIDNKGVLERPWTKWKVLRAISSTLKFQVTVKCWKVDFLMPCKTKSCQSSTEYLRMVRALPPDTPGPPQISTWITKKTVFVKNSIFPGSLTGA